MSLYDRHEGDGESEQNEVTEKNIRLASWMILNAPLGVSLVVDSVRLSSAYSDM
jgi:hypothetical protein